MSLTLYNTLARRKEPFAPLDAGRGVRMYVCGPTVYDRIHIGNARPFIIFDVLYRLLKHEYNRQDIKVTYVRNITDIDDKINARAKERGISIRELTETTTRQFFEDVTALGCLEPDVQPRATDHIPRMLALIETLMAQGHAYVAEGHVLFHVPSMPHYGRLSGRNRDELIAGARVEVAPYKRDPADFVLWKPSTLDLPGWESPWGRGRPGWHIECSAMAEAYLGEQFDIHGGGIDLIFPHHENEIAQSLCAHDGRDFARFWVHNGFVIVEGQKMSKSLGNFLTVGDLLSNTSGEALRYNLLGTHYRKEADWTEPGRLGAKRFITQTYELLERKRGPANSAPPPEPPQEILNALRDDLNTAEALRLFRELVDDLKTDRDNLQTAARISQIVGAGSILGLVQDQPSIWLTRNFHTDEADIQWRIKSRTQARMAKNFAEADRIRNELLSQGIVLEDGPGGTTWRRAG